ncbi:MAG: DUF3786 domain-containing protein [Candidatus Aureabacteria bacterium]|nr:DUF3786 domain-containing protein [Candidatus Auribacterota bacterium]
MGGVNPEGREIILPLWGNPVSIRVPGFVISPPVVGKNLSLSDQALVLHYLATTDGTGERGRWVSFAELPEGRFYDRAFQGYTGDLVIRRFGNDMGAFVAACALCGGRRTDQGDSAYHFRVLPHVPVMVVYWRGEEGIPPAAKLLFDESCPHHLPTDVCAIAGGTLARRLVKPPATSP